MCKFHWTKGCWCQHSLVFPAKGYWTNSRRSKRYRNLTWWTRISCSYAILKDLVCMVLICCHNFLGYLFLFIVHHLYFSFFFWHISKIKSEDKLQQHEVSDYKNEGCFRNVLTAICLLICCAMLMKCDFWPCFIFIVNWTWEPSHSNELPAWVSPHQYTHDIYACTLHTVH